MLDEYIKKNIEPHRNIIKMTLPDGMNIDDVLYSNENVINVCKQFLNETDYIVTKMSEETLLGENIENMKAKYKETLESREQARIKIGELS